MIAAAEVDVLIVGSGPAGISTALHLVDRDPDWADRILVVDKAVHPREKLCGGGLTGWGMAMLDRLGYELEPRSVAVREMRVVYRDLVCTFRGDPVFRVVRRCEFDHWFVGRAEARGVLVRQGEAVTGVTVGSDHVLVTTELGQIKAKALVAADGSLSIVRRCLGWRDSPSGLTGLARLIEMDTPEDPDSAAFRDGVATFDFTPATGDLQGYHWAFPSYAADGGAMNRGVFDSRVIPKRPGAKLKRVMRDALAYQSREFSDYEVKGHPIRWFHGAAKASRPRVLLVGDAAGVDPLLGEGISFALGYGDVAAAALTDAFERNHFDFADYERRLRRHWLMRQLRWRIWVARIAYRINHPLVYRTLWRIVAVIVRILGWDKPHQPKVSAEAPTQASEVE